MDTAQERIQHGVEEYREHERLFQLSKAQHINQLKATSTKTNLYDYQRYSYMVSKPAYDALNPRGPATTDNAYGKGMGKGISDYINYAAPYLQPNFTPDDLQLIALDAQRTHVLMGTNHGVHLTGAPRWARKLVLTPETIATLAALGKQYRLWTKQATVTACVSGVLEAWGNGKFILPENHEPTTLTLKHYSGTKVGSMQLITFGLNQLAQLTEWATNAGYGKPNRSFKDYIKDFAYLEHTFVPYPHNTDTTTYPQHTLLQPCDFKTPIVTDHYNTTPLFQQLLDGKLHCPITPYWPSTYPYESKFVKA